MSERDFAWENRITTANNRTGRTTVVGLAKGAFLRNFIKFSSETVNFVNRDKFGGARWRKKIFGCTCEQSFTTTGWAR